MNEPILLVEDEENDIFFMTDAFNRLGIVNFQIVTDGQQAVDYLRGEGKFSDRSQFPMPTIVLLDLKLPFIMGLDVLKRIRERPGGPIVIILSASSDPRDISSGYAAGANAYLVKPSSVEGLLNLVRSIKDFWLTHNVVPDSRFASVRP
ncbi:MAG TPA: response regulator [Verrucomicrobiae bacterium]|nr:response regulator [Verrucomicrobiae bacterium]